MHRGLKRALGLTGAAVNHGTTGGLAASGSNAVATCADVLAAAHACAQDLALGDSVHSHTLSENAY